MSEGGPITADARFRNRSHPPNAARMTAFDFVSGDNDAAFIFADHASNHVPNWIGDMGVSEQDIKRHIAWDIGTEWVARQLCEQLSCAGLICGFSRLVIDANRDLDAAALVPAISDGTEIPANIGLSAAGRQERIDRLHRPYHQGLEEALDARPETLAISIHSFTPQLAGQPPRTTDIGLLVKDDPQTADAFSAHLSPLLPNMLIEINQPYTAYLLNHTIDHNVVPRALRHLAIELRQDHISTETEALALADTLAQAIKPLL